MNAQVTVSTHLIHIKQITLLPRFVQISTDSASLLENDVIPTVNYHFLALCVYNDGAYHHFTRVQ